MIERTVEYSVGQDRGGANIIAEGFLAYDDAWEYRSSMPAVIVLHQWMGLGSTERLCARELAARGYVGFAADVYGKDCRGRPCGPDMSSFLSARPAELRTRAARGLAWLTSQSFVNSSAVTANGYCFGGGVALEMARAGMRLAAVVTFHGTLAPLGGGGNISSSVAVQIHTAEQDPITQNQLPAAEAELRAAGCEVDVHIYGHCNHAWTDPNSADRYRPRQAAASHQSMFSFLDAIFGNRLQQQQAASVELEAGKSSPAQPPIGLSTPAGQLLAARASSANIAGFTSSNSGSGLNFDVLSHFETQVTQSFCSVATSAILLNALTASTSMGTQDSTTAPQQLRVSVPVDPIFSPWPYLLHRIITHKDRGSNNAPNDWNVTLLFQSPTGIFSWLFWRLRDVPRPQNRALGTSADLKFAFVFSHTYLWCG